jgi:hypothetical protein
MEASSSNETSGSFAVNAAGKAALAPSKKSLRAFPNDERDDAPARAPDGQSLCARRGYDFQKPGAVRRKRPSEAERIQKCGSENSNYRPDVWKRLPNAEYSARKAMMTANGRV